MTCCNRRRNRLFRRLRRRLLVLRSAQPVAPTIASCIHFEQPVAPTVAPTGYADDRLVYTLHNATIALRHNHCLRANGVAPAIHHPATTSYYFDRAGSACRQHCSSSPALDVIILLFNSLHDLKHASALRLGILNTRCQLICADIRTVLNIHRIL